MTSKRYNASKDLTLSPLHQTGPKKIRRKGNESAGRLKKQLRMFRPTPTAAIHKPATSELELSSPTNQANTTYYFISSESENCSCCLCKSLGKFKPKSKKRGGL